MEITDDMFEEYNQLLKDKTAELKTKRQDRLLELVQTFAPQLLAMLGNKTPRAQCGICQSVVEGAGSVEWMAEHWKLCQSATTESNRRERAESRDWSMRQAAAAATAASGGGVGGGVGGGGDVGVDGASA